MPRLKADFHLHTCDDALDDIPHSAEMLIDDAAAKGFDVLAITCHEVLAYDDYLAQYAGQQGIVLIPGIEATIEGRHVLILNPDREQAAVRTFDELRKLGKRDAVVIAPHPYFPAGASLLKKFRENIDVFDAVEYSCFYLPLLNLNVPAVRVAREFNLPLVGTSDTHMLPLVDSTFTWVDAEPRTDAILDAIRQGRVEVETRPRPLREIMRTLDFTVWQEWRRRRRKRHEVEARP